MTGLYRNNNERKADLVIARGSLAFRGMIRDGKLLVQEVGPYERQILREERADALARLVIDKVMRGAGRA